jgi:hypothetical protein
LYRGSSQTNKITHSMFLSQAIPWLQGICIDFSANGLVTYLNSLIVNILNCWVLLLVARVSTNAFS